MKILALFPALRPAPRIALGVAPLLLMLSAYADSPLFTSRATLGSLDGEQIYDHICQGCHMPGGQGAVGAGFYPKLAANKKLVSWAFVALTVLDGRNGMPPFGFPVGSAMNSANAPGRFTPTPMVCAHKCRRPAKQLRQRPPHQRPPTATRSL